MAKLEFYIGDNPNAIAFADDDAVPRAREFINIRQHTYVVRRVTWALDHADDYQRRSLRANVILQEP